MGGPQFDSSIEHPIQSPSPFPARHRRSEVLLLSLRLGERLFVEDCSRGRDGERRVLHASPTGRAFRRGKAGEHRGPASLRQQFFRFAGHLMGVEGLVGMTLSACGGYVGDVLPGAGVLAASRGEHP